MNHLEVGLVFTLLVQPWPLEVGRLPQVVVVQFGFEAVVRGLGKHALLLQNGQNAQRLKNPTSFSLLNTFIVSFTLPIKKNHLAGQWNPKLDLCVQLDLLRFV